MKTAKQILAEFVAARSEHFKGRREDYAASQEFKVEYLQKALDEARHEGHMAGIKEATEIVRKTT